MEIIKLLLRIVIAFVWLQHAIFADCKVIKHRTSNVDGYGTASEWQVGDFKEKETSIKQTNSTSTTNIVSLTTHIPPSLQRSFHKVRSIKRSIKKIWLAYAYYAPEFGLCSCLFKYAWYTYPIIPEVTYTAIGRARRMVGNFMQDFVQGYMERLQQYDHERINSKVAQTTADDYYDYQTRYASTPYENPLRRIDTEQQKSPVIQKIDPKLANLVKMLENLKPKANQNDSFIIRYARALNDAYSRINGGANAVDRNFPTVSLPLAVSHGDTAKSSQPLNETKNGNDANVIEGRSYNRQPFAYNNVQRVGYAYAPPAGLPSYNELPPADYNYFKDGTYHHVHDLRKNKSPPQGGGWLSVDFQDSILQALGLAPPGRSLKPSLAKCGKGYIFNVILRHLQALLLG